MFQSSLQSHSDIQNSNTFSKEKSHLNRWRFIHASHFYRFIEYSEKWQPSPNTKHQPPTIVQVNEQEFFFNRKR